MRMASKIDSKERLKETHSSHHNQLINQNNAQQQSENRFGKKSRSMFFIRHTAHPKNLRFITGVGGIQVCAMKEDSYNLPDNVLDQIRTNTLTAANANPSIVSTNKSIENYISDPKYALKFDYSSTYNQDLLKKYEKKIFAKQRKERILPPIRHWTSTYMLADDTKRWRLELNNLAKKVGIMTSEEVETNEPSNHQQQTSKHSNKNDQIKVENLEIRNVKSIEFQRSITQVPTSTNNNCSITNNGKHTAGTTRKKHAQDDNINDRVKTGRFNESRSSALGTRKLASSRLRTSLNISVNTNKNGTTSNGNKLILCVEESEREMWLLQILCQILNTESMQDIQSWLVSSGLQEKEAMKELIQKALDGLNQSGRLDLEKLSPNPNDKTTQVDFELIKSSITSLIENTKSVQLANNANNNNSSSNNINSLVINETKTDEFTNQTNNNNTANNSNTINNNTDNNNTTNLIIKLKLQAIESLNNKKEEELQKQHQYHQQQQNELVKLKEEKTVKKQELTVKDDENPFESGSDFKSVSLMYIDPYKYERTRTMSTFEEYLSKSTYFQSKLRQINQFAIPKKLELSATRPYTSKEFLNKNEKIAQSLEFLNNPLSKNLMNKFTRVKLVDINAKSSITASDLTQPAMSELSIDSSNNDTNKQTIRKTTSFFKPEESVNINPINVKLKLDSNKDSQVLTIEDH